jgi:acyl dehydratase
MSQERAGQGPLASVAVGDEIGKSIWLTVTQEMICAFGAATLDADRFHDDPDWARQNSPYGTTIAYGFQTIGLLTYLMRTTFKEMDALAAAPDGYPLNYGFDRLRLVSPVPCGSRIRARFTLNERSIDEKGRIHQRIGTIVEIENSSRPALAGEWLSVWVPSNPPQ